MDIHVLDENTVNKIAAGEVIERPVNVVKELVENSIDAGATSVSIEIKGGGTDYIRITDNGSGIEKNSIPTAFLRHATSKINSIDDLMSVSSLGFRGEALSSISAVANVELMTKTKDAIFGYRYCINGGREMSFDEAGVPDGTTIIVRNLFFNTPARLKFLKSNVTEAGYITSLIEKMILSHPSVSFKYTLNGQLKLSSAGNGDLLSCVYSVFGKAVTPSLVEIDKEYENCRIKGFVAKPEMARGNRDHEIFFVNGRLIKSRILSSAVEEAYRAYLMVHKFPFVLLYLEIPSKYLDVNIHPTKAEVRFMEEKSIYEDTVDAATSGITKKELIPSVSDVIVKTETKEEKPQYVPEPFEKKEFEAYSESIKQPEEERTPVQETLFKEGFLGSDSKEKHRIIGQVFDTYWLIEYEKKLYVIDQHAAHEKVLYERFSKQIKENAVASQQLSPPVIVTLTSSEADTVRTNIDVFRQTGFEIEHFGGNEYAISAVPTELFGMDPKDYFLSAVDGLSKDIPGDILQIKDRIATMACKAAVKGNMRLNISEADELITELLSLENPYNCPHGRPTVIAFSEADIEKMFKRIV